MGRIGLVQAATWLAFAGACLTLLTADLGSFPMAHRGQPDPASWGLLDHGRLAVLTWGLWMLGMAGALMIAKAARGLTSDVNANRMGSMSWALPGVAILTLSLSSVTGLEAALAP